MTDKSLHYRALKNKNTEKTEKKHLGILIPTCLTLL